jgi:outer membrane protein TolC
MRTPLLLAIACGILPAQTQPVNLTLQDALERARRYSSTVYTADLSAQIAREDAVQAKAALLPTVDSLNQFIYTQPNGEGGIVFVSNDGAHVYNNQAIVHAELFSPVKRADYRKSLAAAASARARALVAVRGLISTVVQNYYGVLAAQRKLVSARQTLDEARRFLDITQKQEAAGEVAHTDVIKAQIQVESRTADVANAEAETEKTHIDFSVLLFPDYNTEYTLVDDLEAPVALPGLDQVRGLATKDNPEVLAAQASVEAQIYERTSAKAEYLPNVSTDYFFGLNANQFALHTPEGFRNYGSAFQVQATIPVWNWGSTRSKIRQADLRLQQARNDLGLAQRQLLANLNSFYVEARTALVQVDLLRRSLGLAQESLRLTVLRYQAGEVTALEVVDAQSTLAQARNALTDGLTRYRQALADLQTVTGVF